MSYLPFLKIECSCGTLLNLWKSLPEVDYMSNNNPIFDATS